ncbi:MAG: chemotaxis protein CheA, partial [Rhizobiaceae bacterium]
MDDLITQFAIEARELVQQATEDLLALEADPASRERLESVFRAIHTLKGATGLFDFGPMLGVLHQAEDLLSQARGGKLAVDMNLIDPLMAVIEWVDDSIDGIAQSGHLPEAQDKQAARLLALLKSELADVVPADRAMVASETLPDWALLLRERATALGIGGAIVAVRYEPHAECFFNGDDPLKTITALPDLLHLALSFKDIPTSMPDFDPFRCNLVIEALSGGSLDEAKAVFKLLPDQAMLFAIDQTERPAANAVETGGAASDRQTKTMRVESARIDSLVEIAGELVIAKNGLLPLIDESRDLGNTALARRIASRHSEIERLVSSLYTAVTRARMIPLEQVFRRFPRLVRDTSSRLEKPVDLVIEGETVEADREIVEGLFEPLLHLIRNSLDHGIEPEAHRLQNAKPRRGRILLRARQRGDQIEIEMADDGRGMDPQRVLQAAIDRGLIRAA